MTNVFPFRKKASNYIRSRLQKRALRQTQKIIDAKGNSQLRNERGTEESDIIARFRENEYPIDDEWGSVPKLSWVYNRKDITLQ